MGAEVDVFQSSKSRRPMYVISPTIFINLQTFYRGLNFSIIETSFKRNPGSNKNQINTNSLKRAEFYKKRPVKDRSTNRQIRLPTGEWSAEENPTTRISFTLKPFLKHKTPIRYVLGGGGSDWCGGGGGEVGIQFSVRFLSHRCSVVMVKCALCTVESASVVVADFLQFFPPTTTDQSQWCGTLQVTDKRTKSWVKILLKTFNGQKVRHKRERGLNRLAKYLEAQE